MVSIQPLRMRMRLMVKLVRDPMARVNSATPTPIKKLLPIWFQNVSSSQKAWWNTTLNACGLGVIG